MKAARFVLATLCLFPGGAALGQSAADSGAKSTITTKPRSASDLLEVNGARLGMTLDAWRSLPYRPAPDSHLTTACTTEAGSARRLEMAQTPKRPGVLSCSYVARYGRIVLQDAFPLTETFLARTPHYTFIDGQLARIEFHTSVNAFNDLDALFTARFGPPVTTVRDNLNIGHGRKLPRVRREWRNAGTAVWIVDPSERPDQLIVRYGAVDVGHLLPLS